MCERCLNGCATTRSGRGVVRELVEKDNDIKEAGWEGIMIASCPPQPGYEGKTLAQLVPGKASEAERYAAYLDLIDEINGQSTVVKFFIDESDVRTILSSRLTAVISDSWSTTPASGGRPHPRAYGTFPRVLAKYVRAEHVLTLEAARSQDDLVSGGQTGAVRPGRSEGGLWADLVIFDPAKIQDRATYEDPHQYPLGHHPRRGERKGCRGKRRPVPRTGTAGFSVQRS